MYHNPDKYAEMQIGVVLCRTQGVTKWAKWSWRATAVLPGAGPADWKLLREDGGATEFHAATRRLQLHGAEAEAYLHGLSARVPSIFVVLRQTRDPERPFDVALVTASPYEAQDYADSSEDVVEKVPMPDGLVAWIRDFAHTHHQEKEFKKRKRDRARTDRVEDGRGDARIRQDADVFRSPASIRKEQLH